jgi:hypothetical protein
LELILPLALAWKPVATFELESVPVLVSLALAMVPTAVFAPWVVPLLALALVPQATSLTPTAAVAPAPVCGSDPSALPPHTNCACAGGAPRQHASAMPAAVATMETKDNRTQFMTRPCPQDIWLQRYHTCGRARTTRDQTSFDYLIFSARVAAATRSFAERPAGFIGSLF